jgi:hypothetical protein
VGRETFGAVVISVGDEGTQKFSDENKFFFNTDSCLPSGQLHRPASGRFPAHQLIPYWLYSEIYACSYNFFFWLTYVRIFLNIILEIVRWLSYLLKHNASEGVSVLGIPQGRFPFFLFST